MESSSPACYGTAGTLGFRLALRRPQSPGRDPVQAQARWYATGLPDEFSYMEGAQTDVLGSALLVVVAATGVQPLPGPEFPEALSQVLLLDYTLALRAHARRIVNPEEHDGRLFLDESGGPVMLDAAGLEEAVSAWLADASGSRTDGYLTPTSQPAQPRRADGVAELAEGDEEVPVLARAADHSELARLMSSLQQQMADTTAAHSLQVPQQRMPSLFLPAGRQCRALRWWACLFQLLQAICQSQLWGCRSLYLLWRGPATPPRNSRHRRSQQTQEPPPTCRPCSCRPF